MICSWFCWMVRAWADLPHLPVVSWKWPQWSCRLALLISLGFHIHLGHQLAQLGWLVSDPHCLPSSCRLAWGYSHDSFRVPINKVTAYTATRGASLEWARCPFCCIVVAKHATSQRWCKGLGNRLHSFLEDRQSHIARGMNPGKETAMDTWSWALGEGSWLGEMYIIKIFINSEQKKSN